MLPKSIDGCFLQVLSLGLIVDRVEGFAPTSRAAQKLGEAGLGTSTLQKHLVRGQQPDTGEKRLYVLDESSLASTRQVHEFVNRLHPNDRVLLVGDRRQHEAVEAGRPFAQFQGRRYENGEARRDCAPERPSIETASRAACPGRSAGSNTES
ncbi:MAG: AAA family ATPase [Candidatus Sulfotelmatobacter sp.]